MTRKVLDSTLESASFNIIFQIFLRCVTFLLNAFVLRYVSSAVVGVMNVRLLLLESTILFLSRDAFRRAALSQTESHSWPQIMNLVWLTVPLSVVISLFFSFIWLYILEVPSSDITPHYSVGVWSISISCIIEMFAEPLFIASQAFSFNKLKVVLNSLVVLVRTMIFVGWIVVNADQAVVAFSVVQILANSLYTLGFYAYFYFYIQKNNKNVDTFLNQVKNTKVETMEESTVRGSEEQNLFDDVKEKENPKSPKLRTRQSSLVGFDEPFPFTSFFDLLPKRLEGQNWIHLNSGRLTWSFFKQGVLKQILTEGERYIMTLFSVMSFKEQGMYDVVNNLGSLVVRFLFRPVEDSLYFYFTQSVKRDSKIIDQNQERMQEASNVLSKALNCITGIGLLIFVFGQSYSALLLYLYGGASAASGQGPKLLQTHCFSVLLLGINGITECYAFSTMTTDQLNKHNFIMALFSVSFLVISWSLTSLLGGVGFIFANCCIMSARIAHSVSFIKSRYLDTPFRPLHGMIPNKYFLTALLLSLVITQLSEKNCHSLMHFLIGVLCVIISMLVWGFQEQELIILAIKKWNEKKSKKE